MTNQTPMTTANMTVNCTGGGAAQSVRVCVMIDAGTNYLPAAPQRHMSDVQGNKVNFEIFKDAGLATAWSAGALGQTPYNSTGGILDFTSNYRRSGLVSIALWPTPRC